MRTCQCDFCGKTISGEPWQLTLPMLEPINITVNGQVVATLGKECRVKQFDCCYDCLIELGQKLREEI